jgi:hypothetical protein
MVCMKDDCLPKVGCKNRMEWIKCSDRFPETNEFGYSENVLVYDNEFKLVGVMFYSAKYNCWEGQIPEFYIKPSHWMPLPPLPEDENETE